ncbi:hypothetical protein F4781DRAFT_380407 [Annulohypoxylon bovei var. microspora]|nr:hypothetical protein F4781DRAFT_380407 [Annulohypoxylon bovei var. microspora]
MKSLLFFLRSLLRHNIAINAGLINRYNYEEWTPFNIAVVLDLPLFVEVFIRRQKKGGVGLFTYPKRDRLKDCNNIAEMQLLSINYRLCSKSMMMAQSFGETFTKSLYHSTNTSGGQNRSLRS